MSDIIEKTLASLPKLFSDGPRGSPGEKTMPQKKIMGRAFQGFLCSVSRCRSLTEEKTFITHELKQIQESLNRTDVSQGTVGELLFRLVYCHLLGYDVSFGFIHTIKLAQQGTGLEKRMGYIAAILLLHQDHELSLLLMNTIQKDLQSTNILDNCIALSAVCHLVQSDVGVISMMLPLVQKKLQHPRELVRMRAACCILRFIRLTPSYQRHLQENCRKLLYDKDPGVMSIGVKIQLQLLKCGLQSIETLTSDLCSILQQIMNRSLPSSFEYHGIPLPWLQIDILRALACLGKENKKNSESMYPLLRDLLDKFNTKARMSYAVMYECIVTITRIVPHRALLTEASVRVKRFIGSTSYVLKYIGVKALTHLIAVSPESITDCQMIVVELLEDPDPAIQSKTVDLLFSMANESNVKVVCSKLIEHLARPRKDFSESELIDRILTLTEKYSLDGVWGYDMVLTILREERSGLPRDMVDRVLNQLSQVLNYPRDTSRQVPEAVQSLVKKSVQGLFQENCSKELVKIASWVLSECSYLLKNMPDDKVMSLLQKQFLRRSLDTLTRLWILSCVTSLLCGGIVQPGVVTKAVRAMRDRCVSFCDTTQDYTLLQKLLECERLCAQPLTVDPQGRDLTQFDFTLSYLDDFVCDSLEGETKPYIHKNLRMSPLKVDPLFSGFAENAGSGSVASDSSGKPTKSATSDSKNVDLKLEGVSRVWGEEGFLEPDPSVVDSHHAESDQKQRELEKKQELAAALFSGFHSQSKSDAQDKERKDLWSEDVPLNLNSTSLDWRALSAEESERKGSSTEEMDRQEADRQEADRRDPGSVLLDLSDQEKSTEGVLSQDPLSVDDTEHVQQGHEQSCGESQDSKTTTHQHEQSVGLSVNQEGGGGIQGMNYLSREPPPLSFESFPEDRIQDSSEQFSGLYDGVEEEEEDDSESQGDSVYSLSQLDLDTVRVRGEVRGSGAVCDSDSDGGSRQGSELSLYSQYQVLEDSHDSEHNEKVS